MDRVEANRRKALRRRGIVSQRSCVECGKPAVSNRHSYCAWCAEHGENATRRREYEQRKQAERDASRPSAAERGYGTAHRRLRDEWAPRVAAGGVMCARPSCGKPIHPGEAWDLGHVDGTSHYWGPEHRACTRATQKHAKERREDARGQAHRPERL